MNKIIKSIRKFCFDKFYCKFEFEFKSDSIFNIIASYACFISTSNMVLSVEERIFLVGYVLNK